jgi:phosphate transport system substrate-binding protein
MPVLPHEDRGKESLSPPSTDRVRSRAADLTFLPADRLRASRRVLGVRPVSEGSPPAPPPSDVPRTVRRRRDRGPIYVAAGVIAVVAVLVGVGAGTSWYGLVHASTAACPTGVTIQGAGAAFPAAIVSQWVTNYNKADANTINYAASGAGKGISDLEAASVAFAITDEGLSSSDSSSLYAEIGSFLTLPVTGGAVVLVYNLGSSYPGPLNLTGSEIAQIYLGTITTWNDATLVANNPGLHKVSTSITAVHRLDPAGMTYVVTSLMSLDNKTWRTDPSLGTSLSPTWPSFTGAAPESGNSAILTEVSGTGGAIGYTDLYDALAKGLTFASVVDAKGVAVAPSVASTSQAIADVFNATSGSLPTPTGDWSSVSWVNGSGTGDYPLATLAYMLVPLNAGSIPGIQTAGYATVLRQWINWVATDGQTYSRSAFPFVSPPASLLSEDVAALSAMNFKGAVLPACG